MKVKQEVLVDILIKLVAIILVAYLLYKFLESQGIISKTYPTSTAATGECPRGPKYTRFLFQDCDPNYTSAGKLWNDECVCNSSKV